MITDHSTRDLTDILTCLFPNGGWSVKDSEIVSIPDGAQMPSKAAMTAALTAVIAERAAVELLAQEQAAKKTALFLDLKTRLATDLNIQVESPADLSGKIEDIIPAARLKRDGKATTGDRLNELEKQVELLTTFVALLSRS